MDPKNFPSNLDPKLKETYERVMGTSVTPTQQSNSTPVAPTTPSPQTAPTMTTPPTPASVEPVVPTPPAQNPAVLSDLQSPTTDLPSTPVMPLPNAPQPQASQPMATIQTPVLPGGTAQASVTLDASAPTDTEEKPKKKSSPIILIGVVFGILVFFVIYALFWAKLFNLTLPFQLPF